MLPYKIDERSVICPIVFTSPLPLADCVKRVQESFDKRVGISFALIYGRIEKVDDKTYVFSLYQHFKNGRQAVYGHLIAQTDSSTLVDASFTMERPAGWEYIGEIIIATVVLAASKSLAALIVVAIIILIVLIFLFTTRNKRSRLPRQLSSPPTSELLGYFERALKQ